MAAPVAAPIAAPIADDAACLAAIAASRPASRVPAGLMAAIAMQESGRMVRGRAVPWPWSINVQGIDYAFPSKAEAIIAVQTWQATGVRSIDVGCMQVNLKYHPAAFASLDQAFDPTVNVVYAAKFLGELFQSGQSWPIAATWYHSRTPDLAARYGERLAPLWPEANVLTIRLTRPAARPTAPPSVSAVDPYHIYTPSFARQLAEDAADRARRDARLAGGADAPPGRPAPSDPARPRAARSAQVLAFTEHGAAWTQIAQR